MTDNQEQRRTELRNLLGDLPDPARPISAQTIEESQQDGYTLEKLTLDLNGREAVPAYFVKPLSGNGPFPCVLYNHAHGGNYELGKAELLEGRKALESPPYAKALTSKGYAALCIDTWCFGERRDRTESAVFKEMLWSGQVLWGMMVYDSLRALDYLTARPDVAADRIATLGISMGSTMAFWVAALDPRIKVCVDLCCLTDYQALIDTGALDQHGVYYFVPSLLKHFTASQINALIAPRPHLSLVGKEDPLTPPAGVDRVDQDLKVAYRSAGNESAWEMKRYECGHAETEAMRADVLAYLDKWL